MGDVPQSVQENIHIPDNDEALYLFGQYDENLKLIEQHFAVRLFTRGNEVTVTGPETEVRRVTFLLQRLMSLAGRGPVSAQDVFLAIRQVRADDAPAADDGYEPVVISARGRPIRPKTPGQKAYVTAMATHGLVFGIGPAGTGKTYLAVAMAIAAFKDHKVSRIILTRPAVEAGERLGFLPGDLQEKVDPYLRPLYDALWDVLGIDAFRRFVDKGLIEIAPLAYMRGRTLDDSFIILDEAQNTTPEQMKMFLTRLGFGSRAVVTGDITQADLPPGRTSGLEDAMVVLRGVPGISFIYLTDRDVVRHELVQKIIKAYEAHEARYRENSEGGRG